MDDRVGEEFGDKRRARHRPRSGRRGSRSAAKSFRRRSGLQIGDRGQRAGALPSTQRRRMKGRRPPPRGRAPRSECRRPAEVAVAPGDDDPHRPARLVERTLCQIGVVVRNGGSGAGLLALVAILLLGAGTAALRSLGRPRAGLRRRRLRGDRPTRRGQRLHGRRLPPPSRASDHSPGLPLFVAGIYAVRAAASTNASPARVLAILGALAPLFAYLIARPARGRGPCPRPGLRATKDRDLLPLVALGATKGRGVGRGGVIDGADRGARGRDLPGDAGVHGDADDRAARGDPLWPVAILGDPLGRGRSQARRGKGRPAHLGPSGGGWCRE